MLLSSPSFMYECYEFTLQTFFSPVGYVCFFLNKCPSMTKHTYDKKHGTGNNMGGLHRITRISAYSRLSALVTDNDNEQMMRNYTWNVDSPWTPDAQSEGTAVRAARFLNVSSPVSAVLLLFSSRSSFPVPKLPTSKSMRKLPLA